MPELHTQHNMVGRNYSCTEELEDVIDSVKRMIQDRMVEGVIEHREERKTVPKLEPRRTTGIMREEQELTDRKRQSSTKALST